MDFKTPRPLETEHEELHVELERATKKRCSIRPPFSLDAM
jgi:hypothetical protein